MDVEYHLNRISFIS